MKLTKYIPNSITSMNALSGTIGVVFALQGHPDYAFICMLAASVFDFCDGLAARLLNAYSPMGKELDSLADMVSFGLLPSVLLVKTMQMHGVDSWISFLPLFLAVMSALRLAKFNVDERQGTDFIGVATPTAAMIFRNGPASPSRFAVTSVLAQVKKYPIEAPIALMSTNQPSASRPRIGPDRLIRMQNSIAFFGVPYFLSTLPNQSGR